MYGRRSAAFVGGLSGPLPEEHVTQVVLEKVRLAAEQKIGAYTLHSMRVDQLSQLYGDVAYRLSAMVLTEALRPNEKSILTAEFDQWVTQDVQVFYDVPASWWQHFKEQHFPQWALKRWPVKTERRNSTQRRMFALYCTQDFEVKVVAKYPMCDQAFDDRSPFGRAVVHVMHEGTQTKGNCTVEVTALKEEESDG